MPLKKDATKTIELGWGAKPISEQFPQLDKKEVDHFQRDSEDLSRLKIRGLISHTEHRKAVSRFAKKVSAALKKGTHDAP
ncbi:hypothetical protein [Roseovarius sp. MMSF_3350]|uniref:hypothetical protein n=1 Tax=Roseovarius sp. MMSF_3350 TaxID=3046706 RepID=UPI00273E4F85|nr:hypothetical protein [Roseovarius sp. MMSF_3350]